MTFDDKLRLLRAAPDNICGYGRLGREVAEELAASDDLVRRADLIICDLLLMCRSKALNVDLPDIDQWIDDSREAINRSLHD